ncbi:MAG: MFS transporter [Christensenellaceae bacterium]|nr:MFS transporter [Christensenellaceae bacterium]
MKTKRNRMLLLICVGLFWAAQHIFTPYQTPYMIGLGITADIAGIIVGAYGFSQMLLRTPIGINADMKARHKPFIAAGFTAIITASFLRLFADRAWIFLAANLIAGVGSSMWISFTILFSNMYSAEEVHSSISLVFSFNQAGMLFAYILGLIIYPVFGAVSIFVSSMILSLTGLVLSFFVKEDPPAENGKPSPAGILKGAFSGRLILFSAISLILQAASQSTQSSFTSQVAKELGAGDRLLGALSILTMASAFLGSSLLRSKPMRSLGLSTVIYICLSVFAAYCVAVGTAKSVVTVFIAQFFGAMANSMLGSAFMSSAIEGCPQYCKSAAMGMYQAIYGIGMTVGPVIMGQMVRQFSYTAGFLLMASFMLLDMAVYRIFRKKI